ncbi:hypothetical protein [Mucilaginibacter sp. KACC 22063]|uniref:hypothetical protein n=1 Tax=Mucilaginibacter sp. KACC 22063 TaxID=3025666 RepID=UPI002365DBA9|nr:hypothetical protein [Mucilaginibacter sp. KACC 22063]WDF56706.1 hypothetical protein PQ461_06525 [Mucilaginibacter sp. KACC 22063]
MIDSFKAIIIFIVLLTIEKMVFAQNHTQKDTVYYLLDTTKTNIKDRMFLHGQEGRSYSYRLFCECAAFHQDAIFTRRASAKGDTLTKEQVNKLPLITLRQFIHIAVQYGIDRIDRKEVFIITPYKDKFLAHQIYQTILLPPVN